MHILLDTSDVTVDVLMQQHGNGYFTGLRYQRGGGAVGDMFKRVWRYLLPIMKNVGQAAAPVAKELAKEGLLAGSNVLTSVSDGVPFNDAVTNEANTRARSLVSRLQQRGSGARKRRIKKRSAIITPATVTGRLCVTKVPLNKRQRKDTLGFY